MLFISLYEIDSMFLLNNNKKYWCLFTISLNSIVMVWYYWSQSGWVLDPDYQNCEIGNSDQDFANSQWSHSNLDYQNCEIVISAQDFANSQWNWSFLRNCSIRGQISFCPAPPSYLLFIITDDVIWFLMFWIPIAR